MSRDVLLACLALALLLNLAFLGVAMVRSRRRSPVPEPDRRRNSARTARAEPMRRSSASRTFAPPSTAPRPGSRYYGPPLPTNGHGHQLAPEPPRPVRSSAPSMPVDLRSIAVMSAPARVEAPPDVAPAPPPPPAPARVEAAAEPEATPAVTPARAEQDAESATPPSKSRKARGRRFVLPPLDEDQARSAAAIEAFLGGTPPPGTTAVTPQRRRHRARRAPGTPMPRTTMLVWLQGFGELDRTVGTTRSSHVANAFFDAMRRLARTTDEIREVGTGRVRVVIDADDAGASAYVERARSAVQPWLELLTVPLRVETGARESTEVFPFGTTRRMAGDH
jgi:hypothetical protein